MNNTYNRLLDLIAKNRTDEVTALKRDVPIKKSHSYSKSPENAKKHLSIERNTLANELKNTPRGEPRRTRRKQVANSHPEGTGDGMQKWQGWEPKPVKKG